MARCFDELGALLESVGLTPEAVGVGAGALEAARAFPMRVPREFASRIQPGDARDPILRQVLPADAEVVPARGFVADPVGEHAMAGSSGVVRKYRGRVLITVTGTCAVHCRYCFRRHFPYPGLADVDAALEAVRTDPSITEVILSGGDPWLLDDPAIDAVLDRLEGVPHVRRVRFHTRMPVVLPHRVDASLLDVLSDRSLDVIVVLHANHARELTDEVGAACRALANRRITLLNQAVLLAGVNDNADALVDLSDGLFRRGVMPYYLHLLDRVEGAAHFEVDEARARRLMGEVAARMPGYLVPRLVREVEGAPAKVVVPPAEAAETEADSESDAISEFDADR